MIELVSKLKIIVAFTWGIGTNGPGGLTQTNLTSIGGLPDEVKLAVVKTTTNGFTEGDMFFGSSSNIGWLSVDGTTSNLTWATLTNSLVTNAMPFRGGLYVDQTGVWSNNLIAVTSDGSATLSEKGVWEVNAQGIPILITNIYTHILEGLITITNDTNKWGPWAGKILTGDEDATNGLGQFDPLIYAIDTNGVVTTNELGIAPENFNLIPANQDFYISDAIGGTILKLSRNLFTNYVGDLLITQSGETVSGSQVDEPALYIVNWDPTNSVFVVQSMTYPQTTPGFPTFEQESFAPISLPSTNFDE